MVDSKIESGLLGLHREYGLFEPFVEYTGVSTPDLSRSLYPPRKIPSPSTKPSPRDLKVPALSMKSSSGDLKTPL
mgnify:CR=1 FL=1